jgi:mono/diheme cytochrome c family protein
MKYFFLSYFLIAVFVLGTAGFRGAKSERTPLEIFPDMKHQAKIKYQAASGFFADGRGSRTPVANTIPMGFTKPKALAADNAVPDQFGFSNGTDFYNTGKMGDFFGDGFPIDQLVADTMDAKFLERGQQRFNIYCSVCHGESGNGKGITSKYGILTAYNFHQAGALEPGTSAFRPTGQIFDAITNGKGLMGPYGGTIPVRDRWAIIAYLRTLQQAGKVAGGIQ